MTLLMYNRTDPSEKRKKTFKLRHSKQDSRFLLMLSIYFPSIEGFLDDWDDSLEIWSSCFIRYVTKIIAFLSSVLFVHF